MDNKRSRTDISKSSGNAGNPADSFSQQNQYQQPYYGQPPQNQYQQPYYNQPQQSQYQQPYYGQPPQNQYQQPYYNQPQYQQGQYVPPANNNGQQYYRQPENPAPKKNSWALYGILIAIIGFLFAMVIMLTFVRIFSKGGGDRKNTDEHNNSVFSETETRTKKTDIQTEPPSSTASSTETVSSEIPSTETVTVQTQPVQTQKPDTQQKTYTIRNYQVNIYSGAGYEYQWTGSITDRGTYTIVEESNGWGKLKSGQGWINYNESQSSGNLNYKGTGYVSTSNSDLNLRYAPNEKSDILTTIPKGTSGLEIYSTDVQGWYYTSYNGKDGFVSSEYITFGSGSSNNNNNNNSSDNHNGNAGYAYVITKSDPLNIRNANSTSSGIVTTAPKGSCVDIITYDSSWCYVCYNGKYGYASTQYLEVHLY